MNKQEEQKQIAQTIIDQIKATNYLALASWGAHQYTILPEDESIGRLGGLSFKCSGMKIQRGGLAFVELMANDTYKIRVGRMTKGSWNGLYKIEGAYCDMLVACLDEAIG